MRVGKGKGRKHSLVFIEETLRTCLFFLLPKERAILRIWGGECCYEVTWYPSFWLWNLCYKSFQSLVFTFVVLTFHLLAFPTPVSALNLGRVTGK